MEQSIFDAVRKTSQKLGYESWTSLKYQDDILTYLKWMDGCSGIIEVGCYKGGLTCLLATFCKLKSWPLWALDVDLQALKITETHLQKNELSGSAILHHGDLNSFSQKVFLKEKPALVILDGDHQYNAVLHDIQSVFKLNKLPKAIAFHDYSLRHPTTDERVDDAVKFLLGNRPIQEIGEKMDGLSNYPTKSKPSQDGHYWFVPGSEGAIVNLE